MAARRAELARAGIAAGELDELEDHLRAQFAELLALGLNGEEAWLVAERRLGPPREIGREFGTLESLLPPALIWMTLGGLSLSVGGSALHVTGIVTRYASGSSLATWAACALLLGLLLFAMIRWGSLLLRYPIRVLAQLLAAKAGCFGSLLFVTRGLQSSEFEGYWIGSAALSLFWSLGVLGAFVWILVERWRRSVAKAV